MNCDRYSRAAGWLLACHLVSASSPALAADYLIERWSVDDGLPNNALTSVIQTRDGYLWVGSWARIVRFDGVRFTPVAEDLPNVHARTLLEDPDGSVWIGTSGGGVARWRPGASETFDAARGLAGDDVRALAFDERGALWVGTQTGLSVIRDGRIASFRIADGLPDDHVVGLARARDGRILVATAGGVCEMRAAGRPRCWPSAPKPFAPGAVIETSTGTVLVGTRGGGLFEARGDGALAPACDGCAAGLDVTALLEAREGGVWIGLGWGGGVALLRDGALTRYRAADGLPALPVLSLHEDREGSLWIATERGGLARLRPRRVASYGMADGLPAHVVTSLVQDATGAIWAGAVCGPVSVLRGRRFETRFAELTGDACTVSVLGARDGSLWIGTDRRGLFRWDGRRMHHFGREQGLSDAKVGALFEDRDGVVWIGTDSGGVHCFASGRLSRAYGRADGVATGYVQSFAQDREGRVFIGSNANGLSVYENGRFRTLSGAEAPPARNVAGLLVDSRGDLWIATAAHGLFRRRAGRYEQFSREQGLGDVLVALMIEDAQGHLWVSTARGVARLLRERLEAVASGRERSLDPVILDKSDGLPSNEGSGGGFDPSGLRAADGRLWFSTIDGIAVIDPASFRLNGVAPQVLIQGATLGGRTAVVEDGRIAVPAATSSIEIAYTAFSLLAPPKVRFRYRLLGLDPAWQDVGSRRVAYFSRLPPGNYSFEVTAANNDGVWSPAPHAVTLTVAPLLWERGSVRMAALLLLVAAAGFAVRSVSLRRARARLAELLREQSVHRERARIARDLHDDLGSRLAHIALMADGNGSSAEPAQIARSAREAVLAVDELVWAVNARNDTAEGFALYAAQFAEEHLRAAGLRCRLRIAPDLAGCSLGAETRRHLYLGFKEAVTNAVKHAQASEVRVAVRVENGSLLLEVADDGRGFPADGGDPTGNGLGNMRERMAAAGGTLQVESSPERGTRLVFQAPLGA